MCLRLVLTTLCLLSSLSMPSAFAQGDAGAPGEEQSNSIQIKKKNIITRVIDYLNSTNKTELTRKPSLSFIGGPYYSSDTGFGIGLVAAGNYTCCPDDTTALPSNVSLYANLTTKQYFKVGVEGIHNYDSGRRRFNYEASLKSYRTYFWGIGFDKGDNDANKSKYMLMDFMAEVKHLWEVKDNIFVGPLAKLNYISARHRERPEAWEGLLKAYPIMTIGFQAEWDTRDNFTSPSKGWHVLLTQRFAPNFLGNKKHSFSSTEIGFNRYKGVWKGGVLAGRLHGMFTYGHTPWGAMPTLGGGATMRGYYEGQYIDKCETDLTVELRQHVWSRSGIVVWGGAGAVYPSLAHIRKKDILPNFGVGYRWEFKKKSNVRLDIGFGRKCWGFVLNMNEAF